MGKWNRAEFDRKYGQFYAGIWILGLSFIIYLFFQIKKQIFHHREDMLKLEFKGVVDSLGFTGNGILVIKVNHKSYNLEDYTTKINNTSIVEKGDSVIKNPDIYNIKLVNHQTGKISELRYK
ncbi:hypothetical protein [Mucilaginibacter sp. SP1R1]|uniref:hypothetical protein n=1 Tax=Mucilaginibacter sp. SP1R1 TaxID=2723091 RepID=UPI0016077E82|nr:hypothetical protein [Mucilaginibacter sp. SP1R1]MBB6148408.1 hypothetical protein [Mucilaginibacter sp. SP1R1]